MVGDLQAGLIVAIMLVPQGMAYALLAGLPPQVGLYASIVPLFLYGLMGSSRVLAVGPVAIVSLLVASGVGQFAEMGTAEYLQLALTLALLVGIIQNAGHIPCPCGNLILASIFPYVQSPWLMLRMRAEV